MSNLLDDINPWIDPLISTAIQAAFIPPYSQTNSMTAYAAGIISAGSNSSQQYRFAYYNKSGSLTYSAWFFLTNTTYRLDVVLNMGTIAQVWDMFIENDIIVEFRNTAGPVYMNPMYITRGQSSIIPAVTIQSWCASMIMGPLDIAVIVGQSSYTSSRPAGYQSWQGLGLQQNTVLQYSQISANFSIVPSILQLYSDPNAAWQVQVFRKNSITVLTSIGISNIQVNQGTTIISGVMDTINNYQYVLRFTATTQSGTVQPFTDLDITTYMGLAFNQARSTFSDSISVPFTATGGTASGSFNVVVTSYSNIYHENALNKAVTANNIQIKLVPTFIQIEGLSLTLSVFGAFEQAGFVTFVDAAVIGSSDIYFKTEGKLQSSIYFSYDWAYLYFLEGRQLRFNIGAVDSSGKQMFQDVATSTLASANIHTLIQTAVATPNQWVTSSNYIYAPTKFYAWKDALLSFNLQIQYSTVTPIDLEIDGALELIKENAVSEAQQVVHEHEKRRFLDTIMNPDWHQPIFQKDYLAKNEPDQSQLGQKYIYNAPEHVEQLEKGKEQLYTFLKEDAPGWEHASPTELFNQIKKVNYATQGKYPLLFAEANDKLKMPSFQQLLQEYYPNAKRVIDFYQLPTQFKRAPYYINPNLNLKFDKDNVNSISSLFSFGNAPAEEQQYQIAQDAYSLEKGAKTHEELTPSIETVMYYNFGTPYNVWNYTQELMNYGLQHQYSTDIYEPKYKKLGAQMGYLPIFMDWAYSQFTPEQIALITANYAYEKQKLKKGGPLTHDMSVAGLKSLMKDTFMHLNPIQTEVSTFAKSLINANAQKMLYNKILGMIQSEGGLKQFMQYFQTPTKLSPYQVKQMTRVPYDPKHFLPPSYLQSFLGQLYPSTYHQKLGIEYDVLSQRKRNGTDWYKQGSNERKIVEALEKGWSGLTLNEILYYVNTTEQRPGTSPGIKNMTEAMNLLNDLQSHKTVFDTPVQINQRSIKEIIKMLREHNIFQDFLILHRSPAAEKMRKDYLWDPLEKMRQDWREAINDEYKVFQKEERINKRKQKELEKLQQYERMSFWEKFKQGYSENMRQAAQQSKNRALAYQKQRGDSEFYASIEYNTVPNPFEVLPELYQSINLATPNKFLGKDQTDYARPWFDFTNYYDIPTRKQYNQTENLNNTAPQKDIVVIPRSFYEQFDTDFGNLPREAFNQNYKYKIKRNPDSFGKKVFQKSQEALSLAKEIARSNKIATTSILLGGLAYSTSDYWMPYISSQPTNNQSSSTGLSNSEQPILESVQQTVVYQKQEEAMVAEAVTDRLIEMVSADDPTLLKENNIQENLENVDQRYMMTHTLSKFIERLQRKVYLSVPLQHFIKIGISRKLQKASELQQRMGNEQGHLYFMIMKAIINPQTPYERSLRRLFEDFFLDKPIYATSEIVQKKNSEPLLDGLKELMDTPGPVFDFIERISKQQGRHTISFNGGIYSSQDRPVYNLPQHKRLRLNNQTAYKRFKI